MNHHMIRLGLGVLLLSIAAGAHSAGKETFRINSEVFWVKENLSGQTSLDDKIWPADSRLDAQLKKDLTLFTKAQFQLGRDRLDIDEEGWSWNGQPFANLTTGTETSRNLRQRVLTFPAVSISSGEKAKMSLESVQSLEYFVKKSEDMFQLRRLEEPTGLSVSIQPERQGTDRIRLSELTISLRVVEQREPIDGLRLQVGRPILETRKYQVAPILVVPGKAYGILLSPGRGEGVLIFRLRIEPGTDRSPPETESTK